MTQVSSREKWREVEEEKCMCGCKRIRTARSSMKIGGDHMFSEASAERFVCRARTSPFCPSEYVKMVCRGAPRETRNSDFDGVCSCLWCVRKEAYMSLLPCMRRHRSWMRNKSPNLNISAFLHPSPWDLENPRKTRLRCVFVALLRCAHDLTCILTAVLFHVCTCSCMSTLRSSCSQYTWDHGENHSENLSSCTYLQDPPSGVHYSPWTWVALQLQLHINPGFLESEATTPLLRPSGGGPLCWLFMLKHETCWNSRRKCLWISIGGTTKFKFCGPKDVVPHNFTQFFHTNFCGTTFMSWLRSGIITN